MRNLLPALLLATALPFTGHSLTLPSIIGSNMVLQRDQPVPVWGWAEPGEKVTVQFAGQSVTGTASADGRWEVRLAPLKTSATPADLTIAGAQTVTLTNILVGEVWLCSGQSNMEKPIGARKGQKPVFNHEQELASGDQFPLIRLYRAMDHVATNAPQRTAKGDWDVCSSNSLVKKDFSAAAYFFGRDVFKTLNVPIGLVESAWGGTRIEPWTPREGFAAVPKLASLANYQIPVRFSSRVLVTNYETVTNEMIVTTNAVISTNSPTPTNAIALYNGMIAPLVPFALRGALWYQGESNCMGTQDGMAYVDKMRALIGGWRKVWAQGDFPFFYVQIAPFRYYSDPKTPRVKTPDALPEFWEAQTRALAIKNTGMIVTTDITDDVKDIHPRNKLDVGKRLALLALVQTYGQSNLVCHGPVFKGVKFRDGQAILTFDHTEGGLRSRDGKPLSWFTIAGKDGIFQPAAAVIDANQVIVSSPDVKKPVAVRFAWHELATPNLENLAGLPCVPFRTDAPKD